MKYKNLPKWITEELYKKTKAYKIGPYRIKVFSKPQPSNQIETIILNEDLKEFRVGRCGINPQDIIFYSGWEKLKD